jgi:hypothetical protein
VGPFIGHMEYHIKTSVPIMQKLWLIHLQLTDNAGKLWFVIHVHQHSLEWYCAAARLTFLVGL